MPKNNNTTIISNNDEEKEKELLSEAEVYDMLAFANSMQKHPYYSNVYTPKITNNRGQSITMNPSQASQVQLEQALANPKNNEDNLIHYSQAFELGDMVYKRLIHYVGNMLSFDMTFYPTNATPKDLKSPAYKKDYKAVLDYFDMFDYKTEFKKVLRQLLRQEVFYSVYRDDGVSYTLQELPQDYCKITQRWDYGLLFDFNMNWFLQTGIDINSYPEIFKVMYNNFLSAKNPNYIPSNPLGSRDGIFSYWVQTDPTDNFWMWKFSPEIITKVPYFAPLFPDLSMRPLIRNLQKSIYTLQAQKVMVGLIPMIKDNKSGNAVDNIAIKPETMGKFLGLLRQGLDDAIKVGGAPFEDIKTLEFDGGDKSILKDYTQTTISMSGTNSRLLFGTDKPNALETQLSVDIDEFLTTHVYPQFENFLEFFVNKITRKFHFKFTFEGTEFSTNKQARFDKQMQLLEKGITLPQKISASLGMSLKSFEMQLAMAKEDGFVEKLTPIINASQMSGKNMAQGRPKQTTSDLTDSGMNNRDS